MSWLQSLVRSRHRLEFFALALVVLVGVGFTADTQTAYALPEYSTRTSEPCATCHVSPGGGGPRTMRGLLWGARGRPDQVPTLPGLLIAPGVDDPAELYDIACAACHGREGEGLFAMALVGTRLSKTSTRSFIQRGIARTGMPAFEGQFTSAQLTELVTYVSALANGKVEPPPTAYGLPPAQFSCNSPVMTALCRHSSSYGAKGN